MLSKRAQYRQQSINNRGMTSPQCINKDSQIVPSTLTTTMPKSAALNELEKATTSRTVRHILYKYYGSNW